MLTITTNVRIEIVAMSAKPFGERLSFLGILEFRTKGLPDFDECGGGSIEQEHYAKLRGISNIVIVEVSGIQFSKSIFQKKGDQKG